MVEEFSFEQLVNADIQNEKERGNIKVKLLFEHWRGYIEEEEQLDEGVYDQGIFKAIFLAGGPGSGKSYIASRVSGGHGFKMVNSDVAFENGMKEAGLSLNMLNLTPEEEAAKDEIRAHAKSLTVKQREMWCQGRLGQIIDGTGHKYDKIEKLRAMYEDLGYDTYMIFVNTSLEATKEWNRVRERSVDEETILIPSWKAVQGNMGAFQSLFGKNDFYIIDNSPPATPQEMEAMWKIIDREIARKPLTNPKALAWIETEKGVCEIPLPNPSKGAMDQPPPKGALPENLDRKLKIKIKK